MIKRILSALLSVLIVASSMLFVGAAEVEDDTATTVTNPYTAAAIELDTKYGYDGDDLGATYTPQATTFKVWAPTATQIVLNLYATGSDQEEGAADLGGFLLNKEFREDGNPDSFTGIWKTTVAGDLRNIYYTYTVTALNTLGNKETTVETADIYSVATGVNGKRSMVCDLDLTDPMDWENDNHVLLDRSTDSLVWEVHVKDFTYSKSSGVSEANRGKYLGFTERGTTLNGEGNISTCIDYLKELGVTTVQILPFYDYGSVYEDGSDEQFNWGYDPMNYNVPEGSYSSNPYDGNVRIKECKEMIKALHDAGLSVVMDVVYNHTYSYESSFEAVVPNYYYRMKDGKYTNGSGCGNETASERRMYRNYIIQSCKYWVEEFHVDGFRFDLMGLLDVQTMNLVRQELDKIDERITIWGEGWTGGSASYDKTNWLGEKVTGATQGSALVRNLENEEIRSQVELDENVALFNDGFRDGVKGASLNTTDIGWVQGGASFRSSVRYGVNANVTGGNWTSQSPAQCVTYLSCHDNTTLWDKLCDTNIGAEDYTKRTDSVISMNKLCAGLLMASQGITFLNAGEEMGRTKLGDHNSYCSPANINMIDWNLIVTNADLVSYYKGLLEIRRNFDVLTSDTADSNKKFIAQQKNSFTTVSYVINNDKEGQWKKMAFLSNNQKEPANFLLSDTNKEWVIIANDESAGLKKLGEVSDNRFVIPARGIIIAVDKESFESLNIASNKGKLEVEHIDKVTNETIEKFVATGEIGKKYQTMATKSAGLEYKICDIVGDTLGEYTEETQKVTYYYDYVVPQSVNIDFDGNENLNVKDITLLQRVLAEFEGYTLNDEQALLADCNYDGTFDINDITMLQKHLVGMPVSVGTIKINYYDRATGNKIKQATTYTSLIGTDYTVEPINSLGYTLNTTPPEEDSNALTESKNVKVAYKGDGYTEFNFYYDADPVVAENGVRIYVKHNGNLPWSPVIWLWGQINGYDSGTNYCVNNSWPGDTLEKSDEDTWYTTSFMPEAGDNTYCLIITDGDSNRTPDCKGFTQSELWVVIDDENSKSTISLLFYDENPDENPDAVPFAKS